MRVKFEPVSFIESASVQVNLVDNDFPKGNCLWEVSFDFAINVGMTPTCEGDGGHVLEEEAERHPWMQALPL